MPSRTLVLLELAKAATLAKTVDPSDGSKCPVLWAPFQVHVFTAPLNDEVAFEDDVAKPPQFFPSLRGNVGDSLQHVRHLVQHIGVVDGEAQIRKSGTSDSLVKYVYS